MTGPKLNEKSYTVGERSGTRATAKYVRTSAFKAREVLDLIRGVDVRTADQRLQFVERHVAHDVRKVLASAVANAVNNDMQDPEELYVVACFADEGPTLRRFRPRARGRASRINKRSCHITVIVGRMSDERLAIVQAREERAGGRGGRGRPQSSAASRRARVERSRRREAGEQPDADVTTEDLATEDETTDDSTAEATGAPAETAEATETGDAGIVPGAYPGSAQPLEDVGEAPEGYEIKGNEGSMLYHEPGSRYYKATKAEVWFDSVEAAEAAGFSKPGAAKQTDDADGAEPADDAESAADADSEAGTEAPEAEKDETSAKADAPEKSSSADVSEDPVESDDSTTAEAEEDDR